MNEFDREIKDIEQELIDLKTASAYTSVRNVNIRQVRNVHTGLYRVTFEREDFMSEVYIGYLYNTEAEVWGTAYARTPFGNTQVIEVDTTTPGDDPDGARVDNYATLTIVSSVGVLNIIRIS